MNMFKRRIDKFRKAQVLRKVKFFIDSEEAFVGMDGPADFEQKLPWSNL